MSDKLKLIIKTAYDLALEYDGSWHGDSNDFVTASAGSLDEACGEWLTNGDMDTFASATRHGEVPTEYEWIQCQKKEGENYFIIEEPHKSYFFS